MKAKNWFAESISLSNVSKIWLTIILKTCSYTYLVKFSLSNFVFHKFKL